MGGEGRGFLADRLHRLLLEGDGLQFPFAQQEEIVRAAADCGERGGGWRQFRYLRRDDRHAFVQRFRHLGKTGAQRIVEFRRRSKAGLAQQGGAEGCHLSQVGEPRHLRTAGGDLFDPVERRQDGGGGGHPLLDGSDPRGGDLLDRGVGREDVIHLGGNGIDLICHLKVAAQHDDGIVRLVAAFDDRIEDWRKLGLAVGIREGGCRLQELLRFLLQPHHAAEGREVAADGAREQRAEAVEQPDRDAAGGEGAGGQQDDGGEQLGADAARPADTGSWLGRRFGRS